MLDLAAQVLVEVVALDDARGGAAISDRVRQAAGDLADRSHAVLAVHRDDLLRRAAIGDQHAGKMDADPFGHDAWIPVLDHDVNARHDDPEPDCLRHALLLRRIDQLSRKGTRATPSYHTGDASRLWMYSEPAHRGCANRNKQLSC